jgi:hypothetical protein
LREQICDDDKSRVIPRRLGARLASEASESGYNTDLFEEQICPLAGANLRRRQIACNTAPPWGATCEQSERVRDLPRGIIPIYQPPADSETKEKAHDAGAKRKAG